MYFDSGCYTIINDWMELCPNSMDHAGWQEEGLLISLVEMLEKLEEPKYKKNTILKLKNEISITNFMDKNSLRRLQNLLSKYIPFELLTAGWGQEEEKREKKKEKSILNDTDSPQKLLWKPLKEVKNPLKIAYLIYKKSDDKE